MSLKPEQNLLSFVKTLSHLDPGGIVFTRNPETGRTDGVVLLEPNRASLEDLDTLVGATIDSSDLAITVTHFGETKPHEIDRKTLDPMRDGLPVNGGELQATEVADELHMAKVVRFHEIHGTAA